ncbi:hypothetical protein QEZ47_09110 [Aminobacter anthyllidis]|nr:hypothetical protein [Aminobacter anthyllidis]MDH4985696.1 hypothetical protein [Aminobacter anthyllidis]
MRSDSASRKSLAAAADISRYLAAESGWTVKAIYAGSVLHQPALVCDRL